jgi:hypothetical protein
MNSPLREPTTQPPEHLSMPKGQVRVTYFDESVVRGRGPRILGCLSSVLQDRSSGTNSRSLSSIETWKCWLSETERVARLAVALK